MGLATAALAAPLAAPPSHVPPSRIVLWAAALGLYLVLFLLASGVCRRWPTRGRVAVLALLALAALGLAALGGVFGAVYVVVASALAGSLLPARAAYALVGAQSAALCGAFLAGGAAPPRAALLAFLFASLQLFVVYTATVALAEAEARRSLEEAHRRLAAAQEALAAASRDGERLRIARELHDVLGHHLTALSLTLEAAVHSAGDAKDEALAEAQVLTKRLLRDVRQVVSALRETPTDLVAELQRLAAEAKGPRVHLTAADGFESVTGERARALLAAAREAVTNASRHGAASHVWLDLTRRGGALTLSARDDGRGPAAGARAGHGLLGVGERVSALGGTLRFGAAEAGGFELSAEVPAAAEERA